MEEPNEGWLLGLPCLALSTDISLVFCSIQMMLNIIIIQKLCGIHKMSRSDERVVFWRMLAEMLSTEPYEPTTLLSCGQKYQESKQVLHVL